MDIRTLPIGPMEAFVLSRVDGRSSTADISLQTGLPAEDVHAHLNRLAALGAVQYGEVRTMSEPARAIADAAKSPAATVLESSRSGMHPRVDPVIREAEPPAPVAYDPKELDEPADLPPERKRLILDTFYRLERVSHYELLKVPRNVDKKAVKSAYYEVVGTFHPDKYHGKQLGSFKPKLEKIFQRLTEAHDTLSRAKLREEYDRFLESQLATRELDAAADPSSALPEVDEIFREMEREARMAADAGQSSSPPPRSSSPPGAGSDRPAPTGSHPNEARPSGAPSSSPPVDRPAMTADERRRALARKLGAGGSMPPSSARPQEGPTAKEAAADALKRRYESHLNQARVDRLKRYMDAANDAIKLKNYVAATNALRIALSLAPEDPELQARFEAAEKQAAAGLADQYIEQAKYEERRNEFGAAAALYERAIRGRPSAQLHERTAHCLLEGRGDPKSASEHARKAVEMSPNETSYRITLARVYARAGMENSAIGELERARTLDPSDDTIKDWIRRVKRGEV
ncbi:MAG TPA: DnaJ domain-containing protein [Polyangiaceae bacterium]|nr:DnaJ domain-containing protein [Polyangiaceae bacterium]